MSIISPDQADFLRYQRARAAEAGKAAVGMGGGGYVAPGMAVPSMQIPGLNMLEAGPAMYTATSTTQNPTSRVSSGKGDNGNIPPSSGSGRGNSGGGRGPANPGALFPRNQMMGGLLSTGLAAAPLIGQVAQDVGQGRTLDAAVTGGVGGAILTATELGGRAIGGTKGNLIRGAGAILAPLLGNAAGNFAEGQRAEDTGVAPAGASEVEQRKADRSRTKQDAADFLEMNVNAMNAYTQQNIDLMKAASDQVYLDNQRNAPMIKKYLDQQMVRQQALNASQTSNYAMLGTVATAGKLATGAQAQTGATMRAMLTSSPYSGSVMQAPNISFG